MLFTTICMKAFLICILSHFVTSLSSFAQLNFTRDDAPSHFLKDWTFEFGVSYMTRNEIDDFLAGDVDFETGDAGAEIYQFTAAKTLGQLHLDLYGWEFCPMLEMPLCLEWVDENANSPYLVTNASLQLRWDALPKNEWVHATFACGLGLSYASQLMAMDLQRHPNEERSHLKFNLPMQLAFSLPDAPEHQLRLYLSHHSGGFGIFDVGGVNSLGMAYSYSF